MIPGPALFLGDSMTVPLAPYVQVDGSKRTIAQVSKTSAWLRGNVTSDDFRGVKTVFVLIGANDIGQMQPATTLQNIAAIKLAAGVGPRFYVMTLPPFKGWSNYASQYAVIEARRKVVNQGIRNAYGDSVIPLDTLLADPQDSEKLSAAADSGDHLHPKPQALASAIMGAVDNGKPNAAPQAPPAATSGGGLVTGLLFGGVILGGAWLTSRKGR